MATKTKGGFLPTLIVIAVLVAGASIFLYFPSGPGRDDEGPQTVQLIATFDPSPRAELVQAGHAVNGGPMLIEHAAKSGWLKVVPVKRGDTVEFMVSQFSKPAGSPGWVQCEIKHGGGKVQQKSSAEHPNTAYCVWAFE